MKITVKNFQSLADVEIEAEGLTVILGRSNLGKSAFIRAVESALFNRSGEWFVRLGTSQASVAIEGLPSAAGDGQQVRWNKGPGINCFEVNGTTYDKVRRDAPPVLQEWGYRDIAIESGSTTRYLRPQVATQQEGPYFILKEPGSFIADVLTAASRLSVLMVAQDRCNADHKRQRQLLKIRSVDLEAAKAKTKTVEPAVALNDRIKVLHSELQRLRAEEERLSEIARLARQWRALSETLSLSVPEKTRTLEAEQSQQRWQEISELVEARSRLNIVAFFPEVTEIPEDLSARFSSLSSLAPLYSKLKTVPPLPAHIDFSIEQVEERLRQLSTIREQAELHQTVLSQLTGARIGVKAIKEECDRLEGELELLFSEAKVCPVCDQPLTHEVSSI